SASSSPSPSPSSQPSASRSPSPSSSPVPSASSSPPPSPSPIVVDSPTPNLAKFESNMISNGKRETSLSRIQSNSTWEGGVWYYDGAWVFFQIADYIGASHPDHQTFLNGAKAVLDITYRSYAMGQIPGYRVFAHGREQDFLRNGNLASKNAVYSLS